MMFFFFLINEAFRDDSLEFLRPTGLEVLEFLLRVNRQYQHRSQAEKMNKCRIHDKSDNIHTIRSSNKFVLFISLLYIETLY